MVYINGESKGVFSENISLPLESIGSQYNSFIGRIKVRFWFEIHTVGNKSVEHCSWSFRNQTRLLPFHHKRALCPLFVSLFWLQRKARNVDCGSISFLHSHSIKQHRMDRRNRRSASALILWCTSHSSSWIDRNTWLFDLQRQQCQQNIMDAYSLIPIRNWKADGEKGGKLH